MGSKNESHKRKCTRYYNRAITLISATVIITVISIALAISSSFWTGGLMGVSTQYDKVEIKDVNVTDSGGNYVVNIKYVNTGSSPTSIDSILFNGVPDSSYIPYITLGKDFGTLPSICETGVSKSGNIVIPQGATDPSGNRLIDGVILVITLHTTGGKSLSTSITLFGGGSVDSIVQESSNPSLIKTSEGAIRELYTDGNNSVDSITTSELVNNLTETFVVVDPNKIVGYNKLSLGFMLDVEWKEWVDSSLLRELARNASFKLVRLFDTGNSPKPCTYWDEATKTGTFDWDEVDVIIQGIFDIGAEPLYCLGRSNSGGPIIPPGMAVNPSTGLPYPESFAAYATEWVKHFESNGLSVRFYEIWNEPWTYFGWGSIDTAKLANYMQLFNTVAGSMRQENPYLLISFDCIMRQPVLDYWLANGGADVDTLNFHKYDSWQVGQHTDEEMLMRAETEFFSTWPLGYSIAEARQVWLNARGKLLPIINSESNFNSACDDGTDPKIQQMTGAVWTALVLRMDILNEVSYNVYFHLESSLAYGKTKSTGGAGFGMINSDNKQPWYSYYVHYMIGNNIGLDDSIVDTTCSSDDLQPLGWIHNGVLNLLLIYKSNDSRMVHIQGINGPLDFMKIDDTIPWQMPVMLTGMINTNDIVINGYTIMLLQMPISH